MNLGNDNRGDIDVNDLIVTHNKRKDTRLKIYDEIYKKCCNKIKYINDTLLERECYFSIPRFRWGLPLYQHKAALGFIMIKLRGKGFDVKFVESYENSIYINWHKLVEQAMNDSYPGRFEHRQDADGISMDIADTTVPKPDNIPVKDERFQKLAHEGCGGDCCKTKNASFEDHTKSRGATRKQRLELARQQQQHRIQDLLRYKKM